MDPRDTPRLDRRDFLAGTATAATLLGTLDTGIAADEVPPLSEDCLNLNICTGAGSSTRSRDLRPVFVWIHGGRNSAMWASQPVYEGANLAAVVVRRELRRHRQPERPRPAALAGVAHDEATGDGAGRPFRTAGGGGHQAKYAFLKGYLESQTTEY
ncbi:MULTISPECIES: carboxylesterase family protein [unclassified Streptomyces]|uniref:carboxylesterase family protein n=1 Tax=unclassified Streptomyces TaxID=2593676 RepID=UPI00403C6442